jgi:hypothetical protein
MQPRNSNAHGDASAHALAGLSRSASGYLLSVSAPGAVGESGTLSLQILDQAGEPLLDYQVSHEKELHLIVVRSDGAYFRHVHLELDRSTGTWSMSWAWYAAGTYHVYADFVPASEAGSDHVTLTSTVDVAGLFAPAPLAVPSTTDHVGGLTVTVDGQLVAGSMSDLTVEVTRGGKPVTDLQPYLGSFGHLVALRVGDLAYMHVHADGEAPSVGELAGPYVTFGAEAPSVGSYLLYLDFQVAGQVHTATFALKAEPGEGAATDDINSKGH